MVCSQCAGAFSQKHNSRTCPMKEQVVTVPEPERIQKTQKIKVAKPLEGLSGCKNIWKEPKSLYTAKKLVKPLEDLAGCKNIWKEPKSFYTAKKIVKPLEDLAGCKNIWKEPKSFYTTKKIVKVKAIKHVNKGNTTCSLCECKGHNKRSCTTFDGDQYICPPCADQTGRGFCFAKLTAEQANDVAKTLNFVNPLN